MRELIAGIRGVCIVGLWLLTVLSLSALFGVLMASSIPGGIQW